MSLKSSLCIHSLLRRVCVTLPGDAGAGGDAADAAGAGPGPEAQGGRRRSLEKGGKIGEIIA